MENKKGTENSFEKGVWVPFIDEPNKESFNTLYENVKFRFPSKRAFIRECLHRGAEQISIQYTENLEGGFAFKDNKNTIEHLAALDEKIHQLYKYLRTQIKHGFANQSLIITMLSCMYNILISIAGGKPLHYTNINAGIYDLLPMRFNDIYQDLLKQYGFLNNVNTYDRKK
ncbi:MAG TPA: hypothetical protein GX709_03275 [Clostridiales bacterium]|nr:hypothetical protein [Clostridiales bacterium]